MKVKIIYLCLLLSSCGSVLDNSRCEYLVTDVKTGSVYITKDKTNIRQNKDGSLIIFGENAFARFNNQEDYIYSENCN